VWRRGDEAQRQSGERLVLGCLLFARGEVVPLKFRNKGRFFVLSVVNVGREDHGLNKIAFVALGCLALGACATRTQTVGTAGGAVAGAAIGGPVGAVVGGAVGAVATRPGSVLGGPGYRCHYRDRYGHVHYHTCH
jgi:hypothetical protein